MRLREKHYIFTPFLCAIYPTILIYTQNIDDLSETAGQLLFPVLIVSLFAAFVWMVVNCFVKDTKLSALIVSPSIVMLLLYGIVFEFVSALLAKSNIRILILVCLTFFLVLLYCIFYYAVLRFRQSRKIILLHKIIIFVTVLMIGFNFAQIFSHEVRRERQHLSSATDSSSLKPILSNHRPDIYYIILDQYVSLDTIKTIYNYDNSHFANNLRKMGFYIATKSKTEFVNTKTSLAAALNMSAEIVNNKTRYLADHHASVTSDLGFTTREDSYYKKLIRENAVVKFLKCNGYKYIHFGPRWYGTRYNKNADRNFYCSGFRFSNELANLIVESSIIRLVLSNRIPIFHGGHREGVLYAFDELAKIPKIKHPKFVFAHILCPHAPFVFGVNGESVKFKDSSNWINKSIYLGQYIFITKKIEKLVDEIISHSESPPIIVIQSDHGITVEGYNDSSKSIFNAYYLPYGGNEVLWPSIQPVDTFRVIFDYYFYNTIQKKG